MTPTHSSPLLAGCLSAMLLTACGGGGSSDATPGAASNAPPTESAPVATGAPPPVSAAPPTAAAPGVPAAALTSAPRIRRLIVAGDSLADVGTFGFKFTVQDAANAVGFPVFPELVGAAHGLPGGCSFYMDNGAGGVVARGDPRCTNFAVGGAVILRGSGPQGIPAQLGDVAATLGGHFDPGDLLLVDGGGNDASELAAAYVTGVISRTGLLAYIAFLAREVSVGDLLGTIPGSDSLARTTLLYMEKAADTLVEAIIGQALARGATQVAVLNVPDVTRTPRFTTAYAKLVQEKGLDEAVAVLATVRKAVGAFNARLQQRLQGDPRVAVVDLRAAVDEELTHGATYGLTDVAHAACPVTGLSSAGLPEWDLRTCTSAALDSASAGAAPGWWTTWAFSDGFHPTPAGHRLLAATVNRALDTAWSP
ncbi:SGNH/GDSL hydrolase family protein [Ramlibacter sp. MMS24-I3-19]|uniref:SGNH/GDSL hydrolase family protein n=1 Tax=Ramlibacter sp. MMS24-I3-19 TaxID=3416606 RepID=UPI003CFCB20F